MCSADSTAVIIHVRSTCFWLFLVSSLSIFGQWGKGRVVEWAHGCSWYIQSEEICGRQCILIRAITFCHVVSRDSPSSRYRVLCTGNICAVSSPLSVCAPLQLNFNADSTQGVLLVLEILAISLQCLFSTPTCCYIPVSFLWLQCNAWPGNREYKWKTVPWS